MKKLVKRVIRVLILLVSLWIVWELIALKMSGYRCERMVRISSITKPFFTWWCDL